MAVIMHDESTTMFYCKGKIIEEYWDCILNALLYPEDDGKGHRSELIVDDGGDMTLFIREGNNLEGFFLNDGTIPDSISTDNAEFNIFQTIIKRQLKGGDMDKRKKIVNTCMEVSEQTSTGVHHL